MEENKFGELKSVFQKNERTRSASFVFWSLMFVILIGFDQLTKYLAFAGAFGKFLNSFQPYVRKFHYFNYNFAFSLPLPKVLMYILYLVILAVVSWYIYNNYRRFKTIEWTAWILILAGALSNIGERVILGYVRDFIYILSGVFNLADGYIIIGVVLLLVGNLKLKTLKRNGNN